MYNNFFKSLRSEPHTQFADALLIYELALVTRRI